MITATKPMISPPIPCSFFSGCAPGRSLCGNHLHEKVRSGALESSPDSLANFPSPHYQWSFSPNCTWREVVEVLVMAPAVPDSPEGVNTIRLGVLKLVRPKRLKTSARNCRPRASRIGKAFKTEKSQVARFGPMKVSLPTLP